MAIIVVPPALDWSWMKQRVQQIMTRFARAGHTVYYCNQTQKGNHSRRVELVEPQLHVVHQLEPWLKEFHQLRATSRHSFLQPNVTDQPVILWCPLPMMVSAIPLYKPDFVIYDCADDIPSWQAYEPSIFAASNAVLCSSGRLEQRLTRQYPDKPVKLVRNGYDPDLGLHLNPLSPEPEIYEDRPADLPPGPIATFVGAWAPWVDLPLILRAARELQGSGHVVLIGPEFGRRLPFGSAIPPNLHMLGHKPHRELAAYLRHCDVALIPFRLTPVTLAANPIKAYEYLAAGLPVIASALPECVDMQPHVDIARSPEQFIRLLKQRMQEGKLPGSLAAAARQRTAYALSHTWDDRFREIQDFLEPWLGRG
jgi:teichuronic acid biosynthesis glycosyltransferase TuaH